MTGVGWLEPRSVELAPIPFGPAVVRLPSPKLSRDRRTLLETRVVLGKVDVVFQDMVRERLPAMLRFAEHEVSKRMPAGLGVGRAADWSPFDSVAVGLAMGSSLPLVPGSDGEIGIDEPGIVRASHLLAAHRTFSGTHDDPLIEAIVHWFAWIAFVGSVNEMVPRQFTSYWRRCAASAEDLLGFTGAS